MAKVKETRNIDCAVCGQLEWCTWDAVLSRWECNRCARASKRWIRISNRRAKQRNWE